MRFGAISVFLGLFGLALTAFLNLNRTTDLAIYFASQGPRVPPDNVVIVTIDKYSADQLGLPNDPAAWPRSHHADLIDRLTSANARTISFDIFFRHAKESMSDTRLSHAMENSGRVIIFSYLKREILVTTDHDKPDANIESLIPPYEKFAQASQSFAPFPLPKIPITVDHFWTFRDSAGDFATLPTASYTLYNKTSMMQLYSLVQKIVGERLLVKSERPFAASSLRQLRNLLHGNPDLRKQIENEIKKSLKDHPGIESNNLKDVFNLYSGASQRYFNFYGPTRSIPTLSYADVINNKISISDLRKRISGKAVFVGFSERLQPEQRDTFFTVFSGDRGLDISGVELAATAFANLVEGNTLEPASIWVVLLLILAIAALLGFAHEKLSAIPFLVVGVCLMGMYYLGASTLFQDQSTWLPLVAVLFIQVPFTLFIGTVIMHQTVQAEKQKTQEIFSLYLPDHYSKEIQQLRLQPSRLASTSFGVCMATDAEAFSRLGELLSPSELRQSLNRYYETLFHAIRSNDGTIMDLSGDGLLALWPGEESDEMKREQAILAGLEIAHANTELRTRVGLHVGEVTVGNVGAGDHFQFRAVGDIVNTASRIQNVNKHLGTRLLASSDLIGDTANPKWARFNPRDLGLFQLAGKTKPVGLIEIGSKNIADKQFSLAIELFKQGDLSQALCEFSNIHQEYPSDGPSYFFLHYIESILDKKIPSKKGIVLLNQK